MSSVVTYANNERECFCQIKFASGERVLISIAGMPKPSLTILRLVLGGLLPIQTIWEYSPTMTGSYSAYVENLGAMFPPDPAAPLHTYHPLDVIRDTVLQCSSIDEARRTLLERQSRIPTQGNHTNQAST